MNTLHTTRVELPDGRLLTIEGGNAESTARFLQNHYLGGQANNAEEPLEMPTMNFTKTEVAAAADHGEEVALGIPVLNFK